MDDHREQLLGYDARRLGTDAARLWPAERRSEFLLRRGARLPLSVDVMVWPSVFDTGIGLGMPRSERQILRLDGQPAPDEVVERLGLWADLAPLRSALETVPSDEACCLISVSRLLTPQNRVEDMWSSLRPETWDLHGNGELLGYDVADTWLLSGLMNCGYDASEGTSLGRLWRHRLNANHLFECWADAQVFCKVTDARVPEHSPFYSYALRLIEHRSTARIEELPDEGAIVCRTGG